MRYLTGVVLLLAMASPAAARAETPSRRQDCLLLALPKPPAPGYVVHLPPPPCLVPRFSLTNGPRDVPFSGATNAAFPPMPPRDDKPPTQVVPGPSDLVSVMSSTGSFLHKDVSMPMLNIVGMTLATRSLGNIVSIEKDWRTS